MLLKASVVPTPSPSPLPRNFKSDDGNVYLRLGVTVMHPE